MAQRLSRAVLTAASCSFSICECRSAAVNGRGCLSGPGPVPTPVLSPGPKPIDVAEDMVGEVSAEDVMAAWCEGSTLRDAGDGEVGRIGAAA